MKKFSFVIPAYNCKEMLKNSLEALNDQLGYTFDDYEAIVVDDGSDDGTEDYIKGVNRNYALNYIYLKREPCSCRARARNFGWKAAQGEVIVFIDADIIVKNTHLYELGRFYRYEKNLAVLGLRLMLPEEAAINSNHLFQVYAFNRNNLGLMDKTYFIYDILSYNIARIRTPGVLFSTNNSAVPRKSLEMLNGFDESYIGWGFEDMDLGCRLYSIENMKFAVNSKLEGLHQNHRHTDFKEDEFEKNAKYFYDKFPFGEENNPMQKEVDIWGVLNTANEKYLSRYEWMPHRKGREIVLNNLNPGNIGQIKESILNLSGQEGLNIVVNDYSEQEELDIWIQLLGPRKSTPGYFPMSKRIGMLTPEEKEKYIIQFYQVW